MSSSQARNRSRSPIRKSNERPHHSGSSDKKERRNSKDYGTKEHDEKTPNADTKSKVHSKSDKKDSFLESNNNSTPKSNSNSVQKNSFAYNTSNRTYVNPVTGKTERKFSNRCRLFVGNIMDMSEEEFTKMFEKYGEYSEAYVNKDKAFGFIKMDTRMAAEAAKNALDGSMRKGRNLTVRFASLSTAIHVSNLGPLVSNEMLQKAFSAFGDVERAVVVVDDRGRSKGYGRVEFARKGNAVNALQKTNEGFFMIGRSPRPVFTKQQEQTDEEEGLLEKSIERQPMYYSERDAGARFAPAGTFEHEWCQKWKQLEEMKRTQLESLEKQFKEAEDKLESDMVQAVADYEAEITRREMLAKQAEIQRQEEMMRQEMMRQQAMELRRHEEARMQDELQRQVEIRMQEDMLRRQHEELLRRRHHEEAALIHGARMPPGAFGLGPPAPPPGFMPPGMSPVHNPRMPLPPMGRGMPSPGDARHHGMMGYDLDGDRGRERRPMDRGDRSRAGPRYNDHKSRDRY